MNSEALERLRLRKQAAAGIADVPAEDSNEQWRQVLGDGAKKKLRCGICTRPLGEQEQAEKSLVCSACAARQNGATTPLEGLEVINSALAFEELSLAIIYRSFGLEKGVLRPVGAPRKEPDKDSTKSKRKPSPSPVRELPVLTRGAPFTGTGAARPGYVEFSVLSLNLLADVFVRVEGQPWNAFAHCQDEDLPWESRLPRILELLRTSAADIVCLQEISCELRESPGGGADEWMLPAWLDELHGYKAVLQGFKPKEWEKQAERNRKVCGKKVPTGLATLYRTSRFEEFAAAKHGSGSGLAVFLAARDADSTFEVAVGNTHLVGDPSKAAEHRKALDGLMKNLGPRGHTVICGDFNGECQEGSPVAEWISENHLDDVPTGTSWAEPGSALRLDHILHGRGLSALAASGPLSAVEVASGLPCASCPSDHAPVMALLCGLPAAGSGGKSKSKCPW